MKWFRITVIALLSLNLLVSIFFNVYQRGESFNGPAVNIPKKTNGPTAFVEITTPEGKLNRDSVFKIDGFLVRYHYLSDADVRIRLINGRRFYAMAVSPEQLPGVLEILNTGKALFNTESKQLILDNYSK